MLYGGVSDTLNKSRTKEENEGGPMFPFFLFHILHTFSHPSHFSESNRLTFHVLWKYEDVTATLHMSLWQVNVKLQPRASLTEMYLQYKNYKCLL